MAAAFSAIIIVGAAVFPLVRTGMMEASAILSPASPLTRNWGSTTQAPSLPIRHVPTGW